MQHDNLDIQARDSKDDIAFASMKGLESVLTKLYKDDTEKANKMREFVHESLKILKDWNSRADFGEPGAAIFLEFEYWISFYF
mmetsp:Transcript_8709/g.6460  ORF Transcript_8709/g.6460 Transcript_8709/m.6460 type:complete len:83 (-) Transcript_8709:110-358(-)